MLAVGAELVICFCIGKGKQAILSQHIGDLKNLDTLDFFSESIEKYKRLFRADIKHIVCDKHPDYLSTKYARQQEVPVIEVQHHHAHIASGMAENNLTDKVMGVAFDGIGLGDDNLIWGGEFMVCDLNEYERFTHFDYISMPGGDKASKEPWRMAISYLYNVFGREFMKLKLDFLQKISRNNVEFLLNAIDNKINSPLTSSAGRLFDAVAAMIDLCLVSDFHAEAPMRLESIIDLSVSQDYPFIIDKTIQTDMMVQRIVEDVI